MMYRDPTNVNTGYIGRQRRPLHPGQNAYLQNDHLDNDNEIIDQIRNGINNLEYEVARLTGNNFYAPQRVLNDNPLLNLMEPRLSNVRLHQNDTTTVAKDLLSQSHKNALDKALCFILCVGDGSGRRIEGGRTYDTTYLPLSPILSYNRPLPIEIVREIMDNVFEENSRVDMFGLHHDLTQAYERDLVSLKIPMPFVGRKSPTFYQFPGTNISMRNYWYHGMMHGPAEIYSSPTDCSKLLFPDQDYSCRVRCNYRFDKMHGPIGIETPALTLSGELNMGLAEGIYSIEIHEDRQRQQYLDENTRNNAAVHGIRYIELHYLTEELYNGDNRRKYTMILQRNYKRVCSPECACHRFGIGINLEKHARTARVWDRSLYVDISCNTLRSDLDTLDYLYPSVNYENPDCTLRNWHITFIKSKSVKLDFYFPKGDKCRIMNNTRLQLLRRNIHNIFTVDNVHRCNKSCITGFVVPCHSGFISKEFNGSSEFTTLFTYEGIMRYSGKHDYLSRLPKPPPFYNANNQLFGLSSFILSESSPALEHFFKKLPLFFVLLFWIISLIVAIKSLDLEKFRPFSG
jgi:hypothetical protein